MQQRVLLPSLKPIYFFCSSCMNLEITRAVMRYHEFGFRNAVCTALFIAKIYQKNPFLV